MKSAPCCFAYSLREFSRSLLLSSLAIFFFLLLRRRPHRHFFFHSRMYPNKLEGDRNEEDEEGEKQLTTTNLPRTNWLVIPVELVALSFTHQFDNKR